MAYTTSANLITAMETNGASIFPYAKVTVVTTEGSASVDYDVDDRLVYLRMHEEVWAGNAEIWLRNDDNGLDAVNYHGRRIHFFFGYEVAGGADESVQRPDMWVLRQTFRTHEGRSYLILECIDIWTIMGLQRSGGDSNGASPAFNLSSFTETIKEIATAILVTVKPAGYSSGIGLSTQAGNLDVDGLGSPDIFSTGVFNEYEPQVIAEWNTPIRNILRDLLRLTEVRLQPGQGSSGFAVGTNFQARWLDVNDAVDWTIESSGTSDVLYYIRNMADSLVLPNNVIYVDAEPDIDGTNSAVAQSANNAASVARIGTVGTVILFPQSGTAIGNNLGVISAANEAQLRANNAIFEIEVEVQQGEVRMRPHVGFEIFDKITVDDTLWGTSSFTARIGMLEMVLDQRPGVGDDEWDRYYADLGFGV